MSSLQSAGKCPSYTQASVGRLLNSLRYFSRDSDILGNGLFGRLVWKGLVVYVNV